MPSGQDKANPKGPRRDPRSAKSEIRTLRELEKAVGVPRSTVHEALRTGRIEGVPPAAPWTERHAALIRQHFDAVEAERAAARVSREAAAQMGPERVAKLRLALARAELVELDVAARKAEMLPRDRVLAALAAGRERLIHEVADNPADVAGKVREVFEAVARELLGHAPPSATNGGTNGQT